MVTKSLSLFDYIQNEEIQRIEFWDDFNGDTLCIDEQLTLEISLNEFITKSKELVTQYCPDAHVYVRGDAHNRVSILACVTKCPMMLVQISWDSDGDIETPGRSVFKIVVSGDPATALAVVKAYRETYPTRLARVRWYFKAGDTLRSHDVVLHKPSPIQPAYYPFMTRRSNDERPDPMGYMQDFLNHSASLLFLSGPPGTGKTTLLRNFLYENKLRAVVTYEDTLLTSDEMFVDFVTSKNHDVMIIEDADVMLGSREHQGNKVIARFLNASDGIIQLHRKKIIFTTNLSNFKDVDEALIRPGRSYGAVLFRDLDPVEADIAAAAAEIPNWVTPTKPISLAEIFNSPNESSFGRRDMGFRA